MIANWLLRLQKECGTQVCEFVANSHTVIPHSFVPQSSLRHSLVNSGKYHQFLYICICCTLDDNIKKIINMRVRVAVYSHLLS